MLTQAFTMHLFVCKKGLKSVSTIDIKKKDEALSNTAPVYTTALFLYKVALPMLCIYAADPGYCNLNQTDVTDTQMQASPSTTLRAVGKTPMPHGLCHL